MDYLFHIIDIIGEDIKCTKTHKFNYYGNDITGTYEYNQYNITIYGKNKDKNIVCNVTNFKPYFYVKIPLDWTKKKVDKFLKKLGYIKEEDGILQVDKGPSISYSNKNNDEKYCKFSEILKNNNCPSCLTIEYEVIENNYDFYKFEWDYDRNKRRNSKFIKLSFRSYKQFTETRRKISSLFKNNKDFSDWNNLNLDDCNCNLYEAYINPILRFIHMKEIKPCGWIQIKNVTPLKNKTYNSEIELSCTHQKIYPIDNVSISNIIVASFDIECDSLHGDFPQAIKTFKKLSNQLVTHYNKWINNFGNIIISDESKREFIKDCIVKSFESSHNDDDEYSMETIVSLNGGPTIESIDSLLRPIENDEEGDEFIQILDQVEIKKDELIKYYSNFDRNEIPCVEGILKNNRHSDLLLSLKEKYGEIPTYKKNINNIIKIVSERLDEGLQTIEKRRIILKGDPIIQIGTVFYTYGNVSNDKRIQRYIQVIKPDNVDEEICDDIDNIVVERCNNELELLEKWQSLINRINPDFVTGYNIFGFDFEYIDLRIKYFQQIKKKVNRNIKLFKYNLGKSLTNPERCSNCIKNNSWCQCSSKVCKLCKSYITDENDEESKYNQSKWIQMDGRILFDIQKEIKKSHNLESYKLDYVSGYFMKGKILPSKSFNKNNNKITFLNILNENNVTIEKSWIFTTNNIGNLKVGDYISFNIHSIGGEILLLDKHKFKIVQINLNEIRVTIDNIDRKLLYEELQKYSDCKIEWCLNKDDISPKDIFNNHKYGGSKGRSLVAKYCIQDCELCINLIDLLDIIPNNIGMANVCLVPLSYIFLRGQGIKVASIVSYYSDKKSFRIPSLIKNNNNSGYEGAIVLDPNPVGIYQENPICVLDFASLYPSSIIEQNLSPETLISDSDKHEYINKNLSTINKIKYDNYEYIKKGSTFIKKRNELHPVKTCYFQSNEYQYNENTQKKEIKPESMAIIPLTLNTVLMARKKTKLLLKNETNEDKRKVLEGLQLAYKLVANSVYGQLGAKTSMIYKKDIAACTTCIGRERINDAIQGVKEWGKVTKFKYPPTIIYGDTDSVFIKFSNTDKIGNIIKNKNELLKYVIKCGIDVGKYVDSKLNPPQNLEYEKIFYPFVLISKKRYIGDKWESIDDVTNNSCKRTSMGIVMKRRDNAPIVKYVFGNIIERIMSNQSISDVKKWLTQTLDDIINGKFPISFFIISKSLNSHYINPESIPHKVLAERIGKKDPGKKPKSGDRIPFIYKVIEELEPCGFERISKKVPNGRYKNGNAKYKTVKVNGKQKFKKKHIKPGDRLEHPEFMEDSDKIDYKFYISNQIMNPVKQVLDLNSQNKNEYEELFKNYIN